MKSKILCNHWYLPLMVDIRVKEWGDGNREETAIFSNIQVKCKFCGNIALKESDDQHPDYIKQSAEEI